MFRTLSVAVIFFTLSCVTVENNAEHRYTTKYDSIDLDSVVNNERLLKNYVDCLLDKGRCTPDGSELKSHIKDALETDCSKCSERQREGANFILNFLIDNKPEFWKPLEAKYDPEGSYKKKYLEAKDNEVTTAESVTVI